MFLKTIRYSIVLWVMAFGSEALAELVLFGSGANQFSMEFVPIGDPGNAADTTGSPNPAGAVAYNYQMGKYEVSRDMAIKANSLGGLGIDLSDMTSRGGNGPNRPATGVSWNEAARFVNWLNTSRGGFAAYKFTTTGVNDNIALWTLADTLDYNAANQFRSLRAHYVLPSFDEWYKAAYYDPTTSTYFDYPTGSNIAPRAVAGGNSPGTAVYGGNPGPADVNNAGGLSPSGIMGLGGNVIEWQETAISLVNNSILSNRLRRGGNWGSNSNGLLPLDITNGQASLENFTTGFRVVSLSAPINTVPEPSSIVIGCLMSLSGLLFRSRRPRPKKPRAIGRNHVISGVCRFIVKASRFVN